MRKKELLFLCLQIDSFSVFRLNCSPLEYWLLAFLAIFMITFFYSIDIHSNWCLHALLRDQQYISLVLQKFFIDIALSRARRLVLTIIIPSIDWKHDDSYGFNCCILEYVKLNWWWTCWRKIYWYMWTNSVDSLWSHHKYHKKVGDFTLLGVLLGGLQAGRHQLVKRLHSIVGVNNCS